MVKLIVDGKDKTVVDVGGACKWWVQRNKLSISSDAVERDVRAGMVVRCANHSIQLAEVSPGVSRSVVKDAKTTDRRARLHRALDRALDTKRATDDARRIARWESRSGKDWVELYFNPAFKLANGQVVVDAYYRANQSGGGVQAKTEAEAITAVQRMVDRGQFLPDAAKTPMKRVSDWISKPAPAQRKVLSILKPEDLERMTGIKGAKLKDAAPSSGFYVEFAKRPGQFFKVANEDDKHVDAACKKAGLYKKGAEYPGFTIYKDGEEWGGGGGSNSGTMKDAASCPNCVAGKRPNGKVCGKCGGTGKANDTSPFDRDTDAGAAKIVKREAAAGLTARQIVAKYGFSLSFVQEEMGGGKGKDTALSLLPI